MATVPKFKQWNPDETRKRLEDLFGTEHTADVAADALGLGPTGRRTVFRWMSGETRITGPAQVALELMDKCPRELLPKRLQVLMAEAG